MNLGVVYMHQGFLDMAILEFRRACRLSSSNPDILYNLGHALAHRGCLEEARSVLDSALKYEPGMLEALLLLGGIEVKLGFLDDAEERFSMLLEWDHEDAEAFASLGHIWFQREDYKQAQLFLAKALELRPDHGGFQFLMAQTLAKSKKISRAVVHARKATRFSPDNAEFHLFLGDLLFQRGMKAAAEEAWEEALSLNPDLDYALEERTPQRQSQAE